jgi:hypothetical protein
MCCFLLLTYYKCNMFQWSSFVRLSSECQVRAIVGDLISHILIESQAFNLQSQEAHYMFTFKLRTPNIWIPSSMLLRMMLSSFGTHKTIYRS